MDRILVAEVEVTAVADGRAALEALERRPLPDAALLDVEMPCNPDQIVAAVRRHDRARLRLTA
jgi:CheY-like chemotaxis protein